MHILIIPDGNRRWTKRFWVRLLAKIFKKDLGYGHRQGVETFKEVLEEALRMEIPYITIWACTPNNLQKRPKEEVAFLHSLIETAFRRLAKSEEVHSKRVRIKAVGRWQDRALCPPALQEAIQECMQATDCYEKFNLTILTAYSGIEEMEDAISRMVADGFFLRGCKIDYEVIKKYLWTGHLPDVDLIIRTGVRGDPHNSDGVMMWHTAFSQYYFTKTYWPEFTAKEFRLAVKEFSARERRYGR